MEQGEAYDDVVLGCNGPLVHELVHVFFVADDNEKVDCHMELPALVEELD